MNRKPRVLIVNAYLDDARRPTRRPTTVLRTMAPAFLAGAFRRGACDIKLWDEHACGPLADGGLLGWPDLLVLSGLTGSFDRMLHLTAYARTQNPRVVVAAGGPAIRTLPRYSRRFFDYCCTGDVEQMRDVADDVFGPGHTDQEMVPRPDLAPWLGSFSHVESTRNCNFACSFCSLTAENREYFGYDLEHLRRQIMAGGRKRFLIFTDNNFFGNDSRHFAARLDLIRGMWRQGWFGGWGALVTSDFFAHAGNLARVRDAGCKALFCGIESFDVASVRRFHKTQNTLLPQVDLIRGCLESGVLLIYGLIADVVHRTAQSIRDELAFVVGRSEITLPSFVVLPIPFPGTPFFREMARSRRLLPETRLRDLDGTTLCLRPLDPMDEVVKLIRDLQSLRGLRLRAVRHAAGFLARYGRSLDLKQLLVALARDAALIGLPSVVRAGALHASMLLGRGRTVRTHVSTTEGLDALYTPSLPVAPRYRDHFVPTRITDGAGELVGELADELLGSAVARPEAAAGVPGFVRG
jgi:hypothetical protein